MKTLKYIEGIGKFVFTDDSALFIKRKATEMDLLHFLNKFNNNNTCMNIKTEGNNYNT